MGFCHQISWSCSHFIILSLAFSCVLRSTDLCDDLTFLLDEDLSSINLCSLHCEMRNCEQLLGSLGLFAHLVGSLDEPNQALSDHGHGSCRGFLRVTVKQRPDQQTAVERNNIKVTSFSGFLDERLHPVIIDFGKSVSLMKAKNPPAKPLHIRDSTRIVTLFQHLLMVPDNHLLKVTSTCWLFWSKLCIDFHTFETLLLSRML